MGSAAPPPAAGSVVAVHRSPGHTMAKASQPAIELLAGLGVEGDAHAGATVKHRSRVRRDPTQPASCSASRPVRGSVRAT